MISLCGGISKVPDGQFGFSLEFMENLDVEAYLHANTLDLCVVIPTYTMAFGGLGILATPRHGWDERFVLWALVAPIADLVETFLCRFICRQPSQFWVQVASLANQVKYTAGGLIIFIIIFHLLRPQGGASISKKVKEK